MTIKNNNKNNKCNIYLKQFFQTPKYITCTSHSLIKTIHCILNDRHTQRTNNTLTNDICYSDSHRTVISSYKMIIVPVHLMEWYRNHTNINSFNVGDFST